MALEFTNNLNPTGFTPGDRYWRANRPYVEGGPDTIRCTPEESTYVGTYSRHSAGEGSNIHIFTRINPIDGTEEERVFDINNFYWRKNNTGGNKRKRTRKAKRSFKRRALSKGR